jgi:hypothetical protein
MWTKPETSPCPITTSARPLDFKQVGAALGVSENAAKTRVSRATEKLRTFFSRRGVALSAAAIGVLVSANSLHAAPLGLATSVTVAAVKGTAVTTSTLTIVKTTLKLMAWTKFKTAAAATAIALLLTGSGTIVLQTVKAQTDAGKGSIKSAAFAPAGYATAEAAYKSRLWEMSQGDLEMVLAACTAEQAERLKRKVKGKREDEIRRLLIEEANHMGAYQIAKKEVISDEEVRLHLLVQPYPGHPKIGNDVQVMNKVGSQWRYAGKYGTDIKDN